jgi:hypothetical protein
MKSIFLSGWLLLPAVLQGMELSNFDKAAMTKYLSTARADTQQRAVSMHSQTAGAEDSVRAKNDLKYEIHELLLAYPELCDDRELLKSYLALNAAIDSWHQGTSASDFKRAKETLTNQIPRCWEDAIPD